MKEVGSLLAAFLQEAARNDDVAVVFLGELWPRIVGEDLARATRPLELTRKKLVLGVVDAQWRRELLPMRGLLVESVNRFWKAPLIERITLRIHPTKS